MSKILTIFGATGNQGGSIVKYVVADPVLSKEYTVRVVTRNTTQPAAQALASQGIEVVQADLDDALSVQDAVGGSHTVFGITTTIYDSELKAREVRQGRTLADACVDAGVSYLIWSTLSSPSKESNGKYTKVESFDCKTEVEEYIRSLSPKIKSAFFAPGSFMGNYLRWVRPLNDGTFGFANVISPDAKLPLIDVEGDTGKYVGAILAEPEKFEGKIMSAATGFYSLEKVAEVMSMVSGKTVKYSQVASDVYKHALPFPPAAKDCLVEMMLFAEECGYYGSESKEKVAWTVENARGRLTPLEEFIKNNQPPALL